MLRSAWPARLAGAAVVQACESKTVVYEDSFDRLEPTWGWEDLDYYAEDGELFIEAYEDEATRVFNQFSYYSISADICVTATSFDIKKADEATASVLFWGADYDNYYAFLIAPQGEAAVFRMQKGKMLFQDPVDQFDAVKKGEKGLERPPRRGQGQDRLVLRQRQEIQADQRIATGERLAGGLARLWRER